eukprot:TRINITY_DN12016_c0_g1_i1.p1 TRINITY_DN12016_c0_g1~~TRINITY_DN12016_c0_g1_i1.p1  ORF type:complete len:54 (+),score=0.96 TRINITY_DN12016_c0_g1_i1:313-474(+)
MSECSSTMHLTHVVPSNPQILATLLFFEVRVSSFYYEPSGNFLYFFSWSVFVL